jgi:hypothetical protein
MRASGSCPQVCLGKIQWYRCACYVQTTYRTDSIKQDCVSQKGHHNTVSQMHHILHITYYHVRGDEQGLEVFSKILLVAIVGLCTADSLCLYPSYAFFPVMAPWSNTYPPRE